MLKKVDDWTYIRLGLLWILLATVAKCYQHIDELQKKREIKDAEKVDIDMINEFAPKIVEGVEKLKKWSESI